MEQDPIKMFKALADKSRLLIINNLIESPMYVELLSERLGLAPSTVSFHLKKLEEAKLVSSVKEQYYVVYHLNKSILSSTLLDLVSGGKKEDTAQSVREQKYKEGVLKAFFEYGKLKSIPVQQKKRLIILEEIAKAFERDRKYSEKEVNLIIADFHDDFCTLRREMICSKILQRENGIYELM